MLSHPLQGKVLPLQTEKERIDSSNILSDIFYKLNGYFLLIKNRSSLRCETRGSNFFINSNVCKE